MEKRRAPEVKKFNACVLMDELEWFHYWNHRLWQAVAEENLEAEYRGIAFLYCKPLSLEKP
jgi:hypothetical protein